VRWFVVVVDFDRGLFRGPSCGPAVVVVVFVRFEFGGRGSHPLELGRVAPKCQKRTANTAASLL
jgi:hypothetical protein